MQNFEQKQALWKSYWEGTNELPLVAMTVPKPGVEQPEGPRYLEAFDGGKDLFQKVADKAARSCESRIYLGAAMPYYCVSFGSDDFAAYLGADLKLAEDGTTSWPVHPLTSLKNVKIAFDPNGKWWTRTAEFYTVLRRTLGDSVMIAAPTLSAGVDGLAGLYGVSELIESMIDEPEAVMEALAQINQAFTDVMAEVRKLFEFDKYGSINRHGMYVNGSTGVPQCDFSCMISEDMFEEFALPSIQHEMSELDAVEYHLDGPGAVRHLETLCRQDRIHTIQWVAGEGNAADQDWTWLYQKIISLGKAILGDGGMKSTLRLQNVLQTNAAYYRVGARTEEDAKRFFEDLAAIPIVKRGKKS